MGMSTARGEERRTEHTEMHGELGLPRRSRPRRMLLGRSLAVVATAIVLAAYARESFALGGQDAELRILYTSSLNGNLDGCACGSAPRAGLVKRAAYLRAHRVAGDLLLDVGDVFDVSPDTLLS